ncbi:hypothetical protein BH20ACT9_BH20ACT9_03040 [soil metagenome]
MPTIERSAQEQRTEAMARYFRVLGDPLRLRILELLLDRERTVSELVEAIGASQSRVSNHLACLRWCRLVESERAGRNVVYRISDARVDGLLGMSEQLSEQHSAHLAGCQRIGPDWV